MSLWLWSAFSLQGVISVLGFHQVTAAEFVYRAMDAPANPAVDLLTHRRPYSPNRAEAKAYPGSCS